MVLFVCLYLIKYWNLNNAKSFLGCSRTQQEMRFGISLLVTQIIVVRVFPQETEQ